eukprot:scaffold6131_cov72-Attheya_sp.AAC.8
MGGVVSSMEPATTSIVPRIFVRVHSKYMTMASEGCVTDEIIRADGKMDQVTAAPQTPAVAELEAKLNVKAVKA